ncbi:hypothetical protein [Pararhodospirillum oryzae]|uniref:hypothetical protein n=1 Tax=Pararhodospirillum oryzae TaxID=478448 RepID=UPI001478BE5A|nr:hypothetical protein [Pararhodospirillum oryzae]
MQHGIPQSNAGMVAQQCHFVGQVILFFFADFFFFPKREDHQTVSLVLAWRRGLRLIQPNRSIRPRMHHNRHTVLQGSGRHTTHFPDPPWNPEEEKFFMVFSLYLFNLKLHQTPGELGALITRCHQISMGLPAASWAAISSRWAGKLL